MSQVSLSKNWLGKRRILLLLGAVLLVFGLYVLEIGPRQMVPSPNGLTLAGDFLKAAFTPALTYEGGIPAKGAPPFYIKVIDSLALTIRYAIAAMSLALVFGSVFGVLASRAWWGPLAHHPVLIGVRWLVRGVATFARSIHELLWALILLTALGTSPFAAVMAIALPYAGTLAKVFSELLDEQDGNAREVLTASGKPFAGAFIVGVLARAFPDLITYALYRFECAVRSSAILGFLGIPTLGYHISTAYEDGHLREIWTYLYALLLAVVLIDLWGSMIRKRLSQGVLAKRDAPAGASVQELFKARPKSWVLRMSTVLVIGLISYAWVSEKQWQSTLPKERRAANFERFSKETIPYPVQQSGDWRDAIPWVKERLWPKGLDALHRTFHIGTVAILIAGGLSTILAILGSRKLSNALPFGIPFGPNHTNRLGWATRVGALVARSIPEYIIAFLLLQIFGPTAWPLVLALAIHNTGILIRLKSEVIDNLELRPAFTLLCQGHTRTSAYFGAIFPATFNRFLLFWFYRWETCIREATVLGMLQVVSLGYLIDEANVRLFYDDLLFYILLGAMLVFCGDIISDILRSRLRKKV